MATLTTRHGRRRDLPQAAKPATQVQDAPGVDPNAAASASRAFIGPEIRHAMICEAAYFLAERRSFCPGHELEDWLVAESDVERALATGESATPHSA